MLIWNAETVRFMRDAAAYGDYYTRLAAWMRPYLQPSDRLCDAGCGIGALSLELSRYVNHVTAVDESEIALSDFCRTAAARENITVLCGDINDLPPKEKYDVMVFSFFGKMEQIACVAKAQCRGGVLICKRNYVNHRFTVGSMPTGDDSFSRTRDWLTAHGVPFHADTLSLEAGQPFRCREDARRFFTLYHGGDPAMITDAFLDERLTATGRTDLPLYLPQKREVGCLYCQASDLPTDREEIG